MILCVECVKHFSQDEHWRNNHYHDYDDDPYFYGDQYYRGYGYYHGYNSYHSHRSHGYGHGHGHNPYGQSHSHSESFHDPNDFTDADAESLQDEGMEDFESDINES